MRLIDKDKALEALSIFNDRVHGNEHFIYGIETAREILEECCAEVDAVPVVRGEWIKKSSELTETLALCSKCSYPVAFWQKTNCCPNCGARMEDKTCR